jgi:hypothetical protein
MWWTGGTMLMDAQQFLYLIKHIPQQMQFTVIFTSPKLLKKAIENCLIGHNE